MAEASPVPVPIRDPPSILVKDKQVTAQENTIGGVQFYSRGGSPSGPLRKVANSREDDGPVEQSRNASQRSRRSRSRGRSLSKSRGVAGDGGSVASRATVGTVGVSENTASRVASSSPDDVDAPAASTSPVVSKHPRSWASVARTAEKGYNLPFFPPSFIGEKPVVKIPSEVLKEANPKWSECLVSYFVGKRLPFKLTTDSAKADWGARLVDVIANEEGFYFFHIPDGAYRSQILKGGPVTMARVPLVLQQWHPRLVL